MQNPCNGSMSKAFYLATLPLTSTTNHKCDRITLPRSEISAQDVVKSKQKQRWKWFGIVGAIKDALSDMTHAEMSSEEVIFFLSIIQISTFNDCSPHSRVLSLKSKQQESKRNAESDFDAFER